MNPFLFYIIFLASLLVPAIYALAVRNRVLPENKPMLYFIWALLLIEVSQTFFGLESAPRLISENLHYLIEILLVIWIAKRWRTFERFPVMLPILVGIVLTLWILEKWVNGWNADLSWCRAAFSFIIALLAVEFLGRTLVGRPGRLLRNPVFLFSIGLILYYGIATVYELILISGVLPGEGLLYQLFYYSFTLGTITNLIYLNSLLCLPTRTRFSLR